MATRKINGSISLSSTMWEKFDTLQKDLDLNSRAAVVEYLITSSDALELDKLKDENKELQLKLEEKDLKIEELNNKLQVANERFIQHMESMLQKASFTASPTITQDALQTTILKENNLEPEIEKNSKAVKNSIKQQLLL